MKKVWKTKMSKSIPASLILVVVLMANSQVLDRIIAKVNDRIILKSDLEKAHLEYLAAGGYREDNLECRLLESLVINKVMVAQAEIDSVIVEQEEAQQNLEQRMQYMIAQLGSREELEKYYDKSLDEIEKELLGLVREQMLTARMREKISENIKVTPKQVQRFFKEIPKDSLPFFLTEVSVGQIVMKPKAGKISRDSTLQIVHRVRQDLLDGASFSAMAASYSQDPGSSLNGGELPLYNRGEASPSFEGAALSLKPGDLSEPVETEFGFHLIELRERRASKYKARHILFSPVPSPEDVRKCIHQLDSVRLRILSDSIKFRNIATKVSEDKATAQSGGMFQTGEGSYLIPSDQLDPNVFFSIDTLQIGEITSPLLFTMDDGSEAYRILYFEDRVPAHQADLHRDYHKIAKATLEQKRAEVVSKWFRSTRKDMYVEVAAEYDYCEIQ